MRSIARTNPDHWSEVYWPVALAVAVLGWIAVTFLDSSLAGPALAVAAAVLLVPELAVIIMHRDQDTLSDWTWARLGVQDKQPFDKWSATHLLALGAYCVLAAGVLTWLWQNSSYWLAGVATVVAIWLIRHLFWGWWR